jgi:cytosine/uracil/thiamine/allantoin permease
MGIAKLRSMNRIISLCLLLWCMVSLSSCEVIGGIFKAGVWTGILIVAAVVGLLIWIIARMGGKK